MLSDQTTLPFGNLDLSKIVYGQYYLTLYFNGTVIGRIAQDPPLSFENGVLSGPGMSVSLSPVPEPDMRFLLMCGCLLIFIWRRRQPGFLAGGKSGQTVEGSL